MRLFLLLIFLAAACDSQPQPGAEGSDPAAQLRVPPPPPQLCDEARKALERLGAKGAIEYDDQGTATVPLEIWGALKERRSEFARTLAIHAACAHPDGAAERIVRIRSESGVMMMEATIPMVFGLGALPEE